MTRNATDEQTVRSTASDDHDARDDHASIDGHAALDDRIDRAADAVGSVWPLHSFVTANPLSGLEDQPFHRAVAEAEQLFGGRGYPHPTVLRQAYEQGRIDPDALGAELSAHGIDEDPEALLAEMEAAEDDRDTDPDDATERVDQVLSKWLAAFLDQGNAAWAMPDRERGFYAAWRDLAAHDDDVPGIERTDALPETPEDAIESVLADVPGSEWEAVLEHQLASLPGWTGFVKQRTDGDGDWQSTYPISLTGYLAVRLVLADAFEAPLAPEDGAVDPDQEPPLAELWLAAWERSYRERLLDDVDQSVTAPDSDGRPDAQLVFCIDTRSEIIRRHVEATGDYDTHGYAGFFGVPMRYQGHGSDVEVDACPPIVDAQHRITERPTGDHAEQAHRHDLFSKVAAASQKHLKTLKSNIAAAFTFVEGAGGAYGAAMASRTLAPASVYDLFDRVDDAVPGVAAFTEPTLDHHEGDHDLPQGMTHGEKVAYAETAFELMGWEAFARLVVFAGHASHTTNNPFDSSLDCGACAGNPGGPSARVLAAICNDEEVKADLRERGFDIPEDTVFLAGEHNTTTDEITLFDSGVPESHQADLDQLRSDLATAQAGATDERMESVATETDDSVEEAQRRAADWAETRPEWGLAGNASFVIGPRELTEGADLDGRAFLHSYDWSTDPEGDALEAIMTGPMVVTQWINNQYYFATVDTAVYGSGSKVTHNPVGNVGVYQGNGGDLMTGLPLQSLQADHEQVYHQPLRLTTVIHAPVQQVNDVLASNDDLRELLDNGWLSLTVLDPQRDNEPLHYAGELAWEPATEDEPVPAQQVAPTAAD